VPALLRRAPEGVELALDISAPRPVITPFTLRFVIDETGARFDACSADTEEARARIIEAAQAAGVEGDVACTLGLGVPSPRWADAAEQAIDAVAKLGGGVVTFSDADISLLAPQGTGEGAFDDVVGRLETALPEVFALTAVLPPAENDEEQGGPEFVATLSPEGLVQLRGRIPSAADRKLVDSFAKARFSSGGVDMSARVDEGMPDGWTFRVLTGLEALSYLSNGIVRITPEDLALRGSTGEAEASNMIAGMLSDKLGEGAQFTIDVNYKEELDPVAAIPTPEECEADIAAIQQERKIIFDPGSANIGVEARATMDDIAEILRECGEIAMEIGGHTDSQGRETMNQQLSQARAQTILNELRMRRVLTAEITAVGYGETRPIADNDTEEGREANRRIEFKVILPGDGSEETSEDEAAAETGDEPTEEAQPQDETGEDATAAELEEAPEEETNPDEQN
jgi:OOP family OmpA-OmpF porin